jgi:hypothetical protein
MPDLVLNQRKRTKKRDNFGNQMKKYFLFCLKQIVTPLKHWSSGKINTSFKLQGPAPIGTVLDLNNKCPNCFESGSHLLLTRIMQRYRKLLHKMLR